MTWFLMGRRWHVLVSQHDDRWTGRCKITVIGAPHTRVVRDDELYPEDACMTCMNQLAFDDCVEESIDDARSRGYVPVELADG